MKKRKIKKKQEKGKYVDFLDWCLDECERINNRLNMGNKYHIAIDSQPTATKDDYAFSVNCGHPYLRVLVHWKVDTFQEWKEDKRRVSRYLLHEMLHILVEPLAFIAQKRYTTFQEIEEATEGLVDHLSWLLHPYLTPLDDKK